MQFSSLNLQKDYSYWKNGIAVNISKINLSVHWEKKIFELHSPERTILTKENIVYLLQD